MINFLIRLLLPITFIVIPLITQRNINIRKKLGFKEKICFKKEFKTSLKYLGILILFGISWSALFYLFGWSRGQADFNMNPLLLLLFILIGSFSEEVFFRGFIQKKTNLLTSAFLFGIFHVGHGSLYQVIGAFFMGIIFGWEYKKTKGITACFLSHFMYNLFAFIPFLIM